MLRTQNITDFLDRLAPPVLAESWDNVGLLVGDSQASVRSVMTCLTVTGETVAEAISRDAQLIVTHHPLPFRPLKQLTRSTPEGRYLLDLIGHGIAVYSAHTAFDSTAEGINQRLAMGLDLANITPLLVRDDVNSPLPVGSGRHGELQPAITLAELVERAKAFLNLDNIQFVGDANRSVARVAVACGSAGEFLAPAREAECDCLVTGEMRFHTCLEAQATDTALLLLGHFASERFAMESLAVSIAAEFNDLTVWASEHERDPIEWST